MSVEDSSDWLNQVKSWTVNHFSVTRDDGAVVKLLRKVADGLEALGPIEVVDVTFCNEPREDGFAVTMTAYVDLGNSPASGKQDS